MLMRAQQFLLTNSMFKIKSSDQAHFLKNRMKIMNQLNEALLIVTTKFYTSWLKEETPRFLPKCIRTAISMELIIQVLTVEKGFHQVFHTRLETP
jgi:hypothetical protein